MLKIKLSRSRNLFSWGIRALTLSPYSHVDFVIEDGWYLGSQPGTGVVLHKEVCAVEHFYSLDIPADKVLSFAFSQLGKPYDYSGIAGFVSKRDWQDTSKWFCSELVAAAINKQELLFSNNTGFISPGDIAKISDLKRVA